MALLMAAVLHFVPLEAEPRLAIARYLNVMAPGSYFVLSHGVQGRAHLDDDPYHGTTTPGVLRSRADIMALMAGTELVEPGLVWTVQWRPDGEDDFGDHPEDSRVLAGVGRKP